DQAGHALGEGHLETVIADGPGHGVSRIGDQTRTGCANLPAASGSEVGGDSRNGSGAIGEKSVGDHFLRVPSVVIVQAAQLDGAKEPSSARVGTGESLGDAQSIESAMAAHKADVRPLDSGRQIQAADQVQVHARSDKTCAGYRYQMAEIRRWNR